MKQELEMMKYIEDMLIKHNDLLGDAHANNRFGEFNDRQIEVDILQQVYDELNVKFFSGEL